MRRIILISGLLIGFLFTAKIGISAQLLLPKVTTFCERKDGTIYSVNDGYSIRTKCYAGSREVTLAETSGAIGATGTAGATGPVGPVGPTGPKAERGAGSVAFIYESFGDYVSVVGRDGRLYFRYKTDTAWRPVSELGNWAMPDSVPVATEKIVDITQFHLIDEDGNVWHYIANSPVDRQWVNLGQP